jgi:hypothetical protein
LLAVGDKIKLRAQRVSGSNTILTQENGSVLRVKYLRELN